jgi:hypothetical protein
MPENAASLCAGLLTALKQRLSAPDFLERHRRCSKDFTRQRCLPFVVVILFLLNMVKRALQDELDEFFKLDSGATVAARVVTKSAFSQARQKLKAEAFVELNSVQVNYFYDHFAYQTWHGFRLRAVDGSTALLPDTPDIVEHFGRWGTVPLARISQLFDPLNKITLEALIGPKALGEREYAARHFALIGSGDWVLLDRGYPAFWLFVLILSREAHFCARMSLGVWNVVDQFVASGLPEQIVEVPPGSTAQQDCRARQLPTHPITIRLLRIELDQGQIEVLITSLLDQAAYPYALFKDLYHQRWPVEEDYKVIKLRVEVENWSGKSALSLYQDFHAKVFTANLTAILAQPAQQEVIRQSQSKLYTYQVNFTHRLSKMKDTVVLLLRGPAIENILASLWQIMVHTIEPIRPGRRYPRNKTGRIRRFAMAYKPVR